MDDLKRKLIDTFEYRVGDIIKHKNGAEYKIVNVEVDREGKPLHFKLQNLSPGCVDKPQWHFRSVIYKSGHFEPANKAIKVLYEKK